MFALASARPKGCRSRVQGHPILMAAPGKTGEDDRWMEESWAHRCLGRTRRTSGGSWWVSAGRHPGAADGYRPLSLKRCRCGLPGRSASPGHQRPTRPPSRQSADLGRSSPGRESRRCDGGCVRRPANARGRRQRCDQTLRSLAHRAGCQRCYGHPTSSSSVCLVVQPRAHVRRAEPDHAVDADHARDHARGRSASAPLAHRMSDTPSQRRARGCR